MDLSSSGSDYRQEREKYAPHKCPYCGEIIEAYSLQCPSCGHELRNIGAVNSMKELADRLEELDDDGARELLVRSFPIPNTREDILEFLIMATSNIDENAPYGSEDEENLAKAWIAKSEQAVQKAEMMIPDDKAFIKAKIALARKSAGFSKALKKRGVRERPQKELSEKAQNQRLAIIIIPFMLMLTILSALCLL